MSDGSLGDISNADAAVVSEELKLANALATFGADTAASADGSIVPGQEQDPQYLVQPTMM